MIVPRLERRRRPRSNAGGPRRRTSAGVAPRSFGPLVWTLGDGVKAVAPAYLPDEAGRNESGSTIRRSHLDVYSEVDP